MPVRRVTLLSALVLLFLFPVDAAAQDRSDRYTIRVYEDGDTCRYQIEGQADQDVFNISPSGAVTIQKRGGLWVDVTVRDDARGTPGTRSRRSLSFRSPEEARTITARSAVGRSTEHKVHIQCCPTRSGRDECPKWVDAQPPRTSMGWGEVAPRAPEIRGPSADEPVPPSRPAGGPIMRVDEN